MKNIERKYFVLQGELMEISRANANALVCELLLVLVPSRLGKHAY